MIGIAQIAPATPPKPNGLGDYAHRLWTHWPGPCAEWSILVGELATDAERFWPDAKVTGFQPSAASLGAQFEVANPERIILHYVGYAYDPKGAPSWLPEALRKWKQGRLDRKLVVMFHELYAVLPPWRRAFWSMQAARRVVSELAQLADGWITSCPEWERRLLALGARADRGAVIPVGSNIPAIARAGPPRAPFRIAIFGQSLTRLRALHRHRNLLRALERCGQIEMLTLVGTSGGCQAEIDALRLEIAPAERWRSRYDAAPDVVSQVLAEHDLALVENSLPILGKSGVYAACVAHGLMPFIPGAGADADAPYFMNDDRNPDSCLRELSDPGRLDRRRQAVDRAAGELAWENIARRFAAHVERTCG